MFLTFYNMLSHLNNLGNYSIYLCGLHTEEKTQCNVIQLWFMNCKNVGIGYRQWKLKASVPAQNL